MHINLMLPAIKNCTIFFVCLLILPCLASCSGSGESAMPAGVRLYDLEGKPARLSCPPGRMLIVNFWATWCQPCKKEIAHLLELQDEFRALGFDLSGILLDSYKNEYLKAAVEQLNITYPVYVGDMVTVTEKTGVPSVPATMIVNSSGEIVKKLVGYHSKEELRSAVQKMAFDAKASPGTP